MKELNCWEFWKCQQEDCPVYIRREGRICYVLDNNYCFKHFMTYKNPQLNDCRHCSFFRNMELDFNRKWDNLRKELYRLQDHERYVEEDLEYKKNIFRERTVSLSQSPEEKEVGDLFSLNVFFLNKEQYALETSSMAEVFLCKNISLVPSTPKFFLGVTNYRGEILTIIDLKTFLGINNQKENSPENKTVLVVQRGGLKVGLCVDKVGGVEDFSLKDISPPFSILSNESKKYIKGELRKDKVLTIVLDMEKIMTDQRLFVEYLWE